MILHCLIALCQVLIVKKGFSNSMILKVLFKLSFSIPDLVNNKVSQN